MNRFLLATGLFCLLICALPEVTMEKKSCDNCKRRWVCINYECWVGLGHKEPNANKCKYYDEEKQ